MQRIATGDLSNQFSITRLSGYDPEVFDMAAEAEVPISIGRFATNYTDLALEYPVPSVAGVVRDFRNRNRTCNDLVRLQRDRGEAMEPIAAQVGGDGFRGRARIWRPNTDRPSYLQANPATTFHGSWRGTANVLYSGVLGLGFRSRRQHKKVLVGQHVCCQQRYKCNLPFRRCDSNDLYEFWKSFHKMFLVPVVICCRSNCRVFLLVPSP